MSKAVVFARSIKPEWLDMTVELMNRTRDKDEVKRGINEYLSNYIKSSINIRKTREILMNTWVEVDNGNQDFRERSLRVFGKCSRCERLAIHWVMLLSAFPIFKDLCTIVGKLSDMQEEILLPQIQRRVYEIWGERSTLVHSLPKNIKTLRDFGVLEQVKPGVYRVVKQQIKNKDVCCLLLYAVLKTSDKLYQNVSGIDKFKELFPFELNFGMADIQQSDMFEIDRIGGEPVISI